MTDLLCRKHSIIKAMPRTSKSPKAIATVAYAVALRTFPLHRHLKSPKKFTQPQLVACLVLKEFFTTDYRGIEAILEDSSDIRKILKIKEVPHYTTLQKAARRFTNKQSMDKLLATILKDAMATKILKKHVALAAIDSTGFESHHTSAYFVHRKRSTQLSSYESVWYHRFPKVGLVIDCASYLVLANVPSLGPSPDIRHWKKGIREMLKNMHPKILLADAGYDSEESHRFAREEHGIRTIIPNRIGRPSKKLPTGKYRKVMATRFNKTLYGQRWQIETVNSIIKRRLGSFLRAKTYWSQMHEMMLRVFTYNVMVVRY